MVDAGTGGLSKADKKLIAHHDGKMMEFDPRAELHNPILIVKLVDPGCTVELQIEDCATGRVLRFTTTDNRDDDVKLFSEELLKAFHTALKGRI